MRISRRRLSAATAALILLVILIAAAIAHIRWKAAGVAHPLSPPPGATAPAFEGPGFERAVSDRSLIIARHLQNDRGDATVRIYAMPPNSPWLQSRKVVATQLDHWKQTDDCPDNPKATLLECAWTEPTRWWPRKVFLAMVRLSPTREDGSTRPVTTFVIIGSAVGK